MQNSGEPGFIESGNTQDSNHLCEICPPADRSVVSHVCFDCPMGKQFWCDAHIQVHNLFVPTHKVLNLDSEEAHTPIQLCETCPPEDRSVGSNVCLDCPSGNHFWCDDCMRAHSVPAPTHRVVVLAACEEDPARYPFDKDEEEDDFFHKPKGPTHPRSSESQRRSSQGRPTRSRTYQKQHVDEGRFHEVSVSLIDDGVTGIWNQSFTIKMGRLDTCRKKIHDMLKDGECAFLEQPEITVTAALKGSVDTPVNKLTPSVVDRLMTPFNLSELVFELGDAGDGVRDSSDEVEKLLGSLALRRPAVRNEADDEVEGRVGSLGLRKSMGLNEAANEAGQMAGPLALDASTGMNETANEALVGSMGLQQSTLLNEAEKLTGSQESYLEDNQSDVIRSQMDHRCRSTERRHRRRPARIRLRPTPFTWKSIDLEKEKELICDEFPTGIPVV